MTLQMNSDTTHSNTSEPTLRVLIAEDEELAMAHLSRLIDTVSGGFSVVAKARNGKEALAYLKHTTVDLVVTDIYMPIMDGLELLEAIQKEHTSVQVLVVSGYQDFSLVKTALTKGALDYILKPISPTKIRNTFSSLKKQIELRQRSLQQELLRKLFHQTPIEDRVLQHLFPEAEYLLAIYCEGGIPSRLYQTHQLEHIITEQGIIMLSGRKHAEWYALYPHRNPDSLICFKHCLRSHTKHEHPHMLVFLTTAFPLKDFMNALTSLHIYLDAHLVLGKSKEVCWDGRKSCYPTPLLADSEAQMASLLLGENRFEDFKNLISTWIDGWEREEKPQTWMEGMLQQILRLLLKLAQNNETDNNYTLDLEECFYDLQSHAELKERILNLFDIIISNQYATFQKIDTPQFFSRVEEYLREHSHTSLTLQDLCDTFGVSQTYMSRLFRKYSHKSCNELLTSIRIQKAEQLLINQPLLQIKDIAELVGYKDQFYFSRLFHREVGMTASEYRKTQANQPT